MPERFQIKTTIDTEHNRSHKIIDSFREGNLNVWASTWSLRSATAIRDALNAAHRAGKLEAQPDAPDWEALCRGLVRQIYEIGWGHVGAIQETPAAIAARDAVRAQEPEPDERVEDKGRCYATTNGIRRRETSHSTQRIATIDQLEIDGKLESEVAAEWADLFSALYNRRQATGTRADRKGGV